MSDYLRMLLTFFAAVNPLAVALAARGIRPLPPHAALAGAIAGALLVLAVVLADPLLDALDIAPESFRIAAGIVMAVVGAVAISRGGRKADGEDGWLAAISPLAIPLLAGPAAFAASISYSADEGVGVTIAAALPVVAGAAALTLWRSPRPVPLLGALARLTGALLVVLAVGFVVDGVRAV